MKLSIVATLYQSADHLAEFHQRATAAARQFAGDDYEIVLVNDGSPDNSLDIAVQLYESDEHVVVVDLSRNFGHHKAMMAGLEHANGERVFLIDSDLEEEPEWLISFSEQMQTDQVDVVYGTQKTRKGGWFERWSGSIYYSILNWLAHVKHPRDITTARLMTRRYVDALLSHKEREIVISFLWIITGFKQSSQTVKKHKASSTTYSILKKVGHMTNAITSFSEAPLKIIFLCGIFIFIVAMANAGVLVVTRLFTSQPVDGWTSIMVSVWVLGGMIISFIGIIGIYLAKIFSETKQRPYVIVREVYGKRRN